MSQRWRLTGIATLVLPLSIACIEDFPSEPDPLVVEVREITGDAVVAITDTTTLQVVIQDKNGVVLSGVEVKWEVKDSSVVKISQLPAPEKGSRADSLRSQLSARVTGLRSESTYVFATVVHQGFGPARDSLRLTVVPLNIERVGEWPDTLFVQDTVVLELDLTDVNGASVSHRRVNWSSSANLQLTKLDELRARIVTLARGPGQVFATVAEQGFEEIPFAQTVQVMEHWIVVTAGRAHSCGVTVTHQVYCWGSGFIGNGSTAGSPIPARVLGDLTFDSVSAGDGYTCGILQQDGTAYCWGENRFGAIGNGLRTNQLVPVPVSLGRTFRSIVAGRRHACGMTAGADRLGYCWGDNRDWQLGDGGLVDDPPRPDPAFDECGSRNRCSLTPRIVQDRSFTPFNLIAIGPGESHTCAIRGDGVPICWGFGSAELGQNTVFKTDSLFPDAVLLVLSTEMFRTVHAGLSHNCGIDSQNSRAYCWGLNSFGQLGIASPSSMCPTTMGTIEPCSPTPVAVNDGHRFKRLSAGERSTCGIATDTTDSTAYCWGSNQFGQLGTTAALRTCDSGESCSWDPVKVQLPGDPPVVSVGVGQKHACAVTRRGAAYCWGDVADGKLGSDSIPAAVPKVPPVRVSEPR